MNQANRETGEMVGEQSLRLSPTVRALGLVSLFTDMSSEMAYTQLPLFLTGTLGASSAVVGLIEGVAESTASLFRLVSGAISDRSGQRKPLILAGYGLGALSKPLLALAQTAPIVGGLRFLDRLGKGLRTAPRDALIAEATPPAIRGRAFGLHRAMDTTGAVLGPLLGVWFLTHVSTNPRHLFLFAGLPGLLAVLTLVFAVREGRRAAKTPAADPGGGNLFAAKAVSPSTPGRDESRTALPDAGMAPDTEAGDRETMPVATPTTLWPTRKAFALPRLHALSPEYRRFLGVVFLFNLGNSSDAFLVLRARSLGFGNIEILWLYAAFNIVEAILGYSAGRLSDRVGRRPLLIGGYLIFALVYAGFALAQSRAAVVTLFLLYGGYYTLAQGTQRAYAADLADPEARGAQIGAYHMLVGIALLPASLVAGRLFAVSPAAPFALGAVTALVSALLLGVLPTRAGGSAT